MSQMSNQDIGGNWHFVIDEETKGPFTEQQAIDMVRSGQVRRNTLSWAPALPDWTELGNTALARHISSPPPLPRQSMPPQPLRAPTHQSHAQTQGSTSFASPPEHLPFMENFKHVVIRNYANFHGRASRYEYWMFYLGFVALCFAVLMLGLLVASTSENLAMVMFILIGVIVAGLLIPQLSCAVRRLHDADLSGWWYLLIFIPYIGGILVIILTCLPSKPTNKYGPAPSWVDENS